MHIFIVLPLGWTLFLCWGKIVSSSIGYGLLLSGLLKLTVQYTVFAENLLVTKDVIKVADFAVVREVCSHTLTLTMSPLASMLSPRPCTNFHTLYPCLGTLLMVFLVLVLSTLHEECSRVFFLSYIYWRIQHFTEVFLTCCFLLGVMQLKYFCNPCAIVLQQVNSNLEPLLLFFWQFPDYVFFYAVQISFLYSLSGQAGSMCGTNLQ